MLLGKGRVKVLSVNELDVAYGRANVLHNVGLHINEGETVFIVGRNGAGKTTLLKTISGLMKPQNGNIVYKNKDITKEGVEKLAQQGLRYVAQDKKVFNNLTVRDNIELAAFSSKEDMNEAVKKVADIYPNLYDSLNKRSGGLSGGQREILLIGRALVGSPNLLLIDEPTEGLAAIVIKDIFKILNDKIKNLKISAIIVEQNLSIVSKLADRIYVMKEGKISKEIDNEDKDVDISQLEKYL